MAAVYFFRQPSALWELVWRGWSKVTHSRCQAATFGLEEGKSLIIFQVLFHFFWTGILAYPIPWDRDIPSSQKPRSILLLTFLLSLADKLSTPSPSLGSSKHSCFV